LDGDSGWGKCLLDVGGGGKNVVVLGIEVVSKKKGVGGLRIDVYSDQIGGLILGVTAEVLEV